MERDDRWERLFADLESRVAGDGDLPDLVEAERVAVTLQDRLRAAIGHAVSAHAGGFQIAGTLLDVGQDWILIGRPDSDVLVPLAAITRMGPLGARQPKAGIELPLTSVLRALGRSGAVAVCRAGGEDFSGRIVAVGADHLELRSEAGDSIILIDALSTVRAPKAAFEA
ncbi:MAG: hypothetical protein L0G23_07780 [Ruaniaceae bacterium]|nr:hypothetical protein [Ruaniaceae bacterium]